MALASADRLADELKRLPMRKSSAAQLLPILDDPISGSTDLARIIETDPAMTTRLLRLANSAFLGLPNPVVSAADAVTVVGFAVVRSVAVSAAAGLLDAGRRSLPPEFWDHALGVAAGASLISMRLGVSRGEAFSAGLLHDIGEALLFRFDPRHYRRLLADLGEGVPRVEAEVELYGMSHADVGAAALAHWGLPAGLVGAVREHHRPVDPGADLLATTTRLGDLLARSAHERAAGTGQTLARFESEAARVGVRFDDVDGLLVRWTAEIGDLRAMLGPVG